MIAYAAAMLYCGLFVIVRGVSGAGWAGREAVRERLIEIGVSWRREKIILGGLFGVLAVISLPVGLLFGLFPKTDIQRFIDKWHISWLITSFLVLAAIKAEPLLLIIPILKCLDLFYTMMALMVFRRGSRYRVRPLGHLLLMHYPQVFVTFASLYLGIPSLKSDLAYAIGCGEVLLDPGTALYFSVVSGATLGFGDIVPKTLISEGMATGTLLHAAVVLEVVVLLGLTVLFVPYFMQFTKLERR